MKTMPDLILGRQPVLEALKAAHPIEKIFVQNGSQGTAIASIYNLAKQSGIPIVQADKDRLLTLAGKSSTQGVVAFVAAKSYVEIEDILAAAAARNDQPFVLVLDEIEDVHNLGALLRTAEGAGVHGVVIPKHHAATINATVMKTSAGAAAHVSVARVGNVVSALEKLKGAGVWVVGLEISGAKDLYSTDLGGSIALVIGSEGKGLRRLVKETCDALVRIPMFGKVDSLNASVSGALAMYEVVRSRIQKSKDPNRN
ncbi:MAG: 23S rRNA (guanosine(2251)-2'-O)-methyltransferase RlmB [Ignavibacteriales bacterium]|nr:23S rRNA (guanosine(2251)-2'-O)-methyltransferase RlmB [Ignavibacteriales bacterium]